MSGWFNNLQPASYKDVAFEVINIEDRNEKALVEHGKPFANGVDLEDMGTMGRMSQMSAVFYGIGFDTKLVRLMNALEESGSGVLVHPIHGRMKNMIAANWSFRTSAEEINYVAIDITFREATESQPIFVFENEFLATLERLQNMIDGYREQILGYLDIVAMTKGGVSSLWGSALGLWSAVMGVFGALRRAFDFDGVGWPSGGSYSSGGFSEGVIKQTALQDKMLQQGLANEMATGNESSLSPKQRFDAMYEKASEIQTIPNDLVTGKGETADNKRLHKITSLQMQPINVVFQLQLTCNIVYQASALLEADGDNLNAPELMQINHAIRLNLQALMALIRQVQQWAKNKGSGNTDALYTESEAIIEGLRDMAADLNGLIVATINQKPPLIVRRADFNGTMHQFAHAFYQDLARTAELIKLNPHLTHPSFVKRGDWINCYAQ